MLISPEPADAIDVPEVRQLPELTVNEESPAAFADMVLTSLLGFEAGVLHADCLDREGMDSSVSWCVRSREQGRDGPDIEIAVSPSRGSFRSVLARFGHHYMGDHQLDEVRMVLYTREDEKSFDVYARALEELPGIE